MKTKEKHIQNVGLQETFDNIYQSSLNDINFKQIFQLVQSDKNILLAYRNIRKNGGSFTKGVDGKNIENYNKLSDDEIIKIVKRKLNNYNPKPVRRVIIPKKNGKPRHLGIPTFLDRLVQQTILQVLEPFCEAKFSNRSHGFRPNRSTETALAQVYYSINRQQLTYAVSIDLEKFFDTVNHQKLIQQLWNLGIRDKRILKIIKLILKSDVIDEHGITHKSKMGTPQGSILSPLLSNIVLNDLDKWIDTQYRTFETKHKYATKVSANGTVINSSKMRALKSTKLKPMFLTRYADDFVIFTNSYSSAVKIKIATSQWIENNLKLKVNNEKSKVINLKKSNLNFLGYEIKAIKKKNKYVVTSKIPKESIAKTKESLKEQIIKAYKPTNKENFIKAINKYNSIVIGSHNYYSKATNVSKDVAKAQFELNHIWYNRFKKGYTHKGNKTMKSDLIKKYFKSEQMRYINGLHILPFGYVQHSNPQNKPTLVNKYTKLGRSKYNPIDYKILEYLTCNPVPKRSIEYNQNRISKYIAQKGKCAITGEELDLINIHCHHIKPLHCNGDDKYTNLIILHKEIHKIIHMTNTNEIINIINKFKIQNKIDKINELRIKANMEELEL